MLDHDIIRNSYVYIYGLRDPRDGKIKYVGQTENMKTRLAMHIAECSVPGKRASRKMKCHVGGSHNEDLRESRNKVDQGRGTARRTLQRLQGRVSPWCGSEQ